MSENQMTEIGLKVGLEIHQQLSTGSKLFCNCSPVESDHYPLKFTRRLRIARSELGEFDPSALFETSKERLIHYYADPRSSCLVEEDDEPPHDISGIAKEIVLVIASMLKSNILNEIHVMRKLVLDGSNTSGFQRTMLVGLGGKLELSGREVGVQSICLEEDAAKLLSDSGNTREYGLDRLGIPLVEIALEPVEGQPEEIRDIAFALGQLLRATKKVARGLGSIRQDVNISIKGGGIVEVKGVQKLDQLEKVIQYEAKRQHGLKLIGEKLQALGTERVAKERDTYDVTNIFRDSSSKILKKALNEGAVVKAIKVKNFSGMFGYEPYPGIRLGRQIGELVRSFRLGGVFHSDELPDYGITEYDIQNIKKILDVQQKDAFLLLAGDSKKLEVVIDSIIKRLEEAIYGVPAETRAATAEGETIYLRPRPGASRMYPETDIPPVVVTEDELRIAKESMPKSWEEGLSDLQKKYNLNTQLASQVFDSEYLDLFESICEHYQVPPNFVASVLCGAITNLERQGLDPKLLKNSDISKAFELLAAEKIAKESLEILFESIMSGQSDSITDALEKRSVLTISETELSKKLDELIDENIKIIQAQGNRAIGPLMGIAMKDLRGRVDGQKINKLLETKIKSRIERI